MFFDPLYMMMLLPALALTFYAQYKVKSTFKRFTGVANANGVSGLEAAQRILAAGGMTDVRIERAQGILGDHYDPRGKVLRLSEEVYSGHSIASVGIAAHEVGHAIQDANGYKPMRIRATLVPAATMGSNLAMPLLFMGMFLNSMGMMKLGVLLFSAAVLFQLVTLPVEFDASRRALLALEGAGILRSEEMGGARSVLSAAAFTYVAAAIAAVMQLVYFALRSGLFGGNDD
jgi:hypothetical protein